MVKKMIDDLRSTRHLLATQTLSGLAQWIDVFLLFTVPSFLWKSSPAEIAFLAACFGLPSLFLGPFIGVLLDRADSRKAMLIAALSRTALSVMIAFAPGFQVFAVLILLKGLANLLYWPASAILTNQTVSAPARVKYFSSLSALDQMTKIGTPLVAGTLALAINSQLVFMVSAALTLSCAAMLRFFPRIKTIQHPMQKRSAHGLLNDLFFGLRSIKTLPKDLLFSILLSIGLSLGLAIYDPHMAGFLSSKGFDTGVFAMLISATGVGAVVGAALVRFILNQSSSIAIIRIGITVFSIAISSAALVIYCAPELLGRSAFIILWFLNGLGYEVFVIGASVNTQNLCPPALLGRISTSMRSLQMLAVISGPSMGAWLITAYSRTAPFIVSAVLSLCLLAIAINWRGSLKHSALVN